MNTINRLLGCALLAALTAGVAFGQQPRNVTKASGTNRITEDLAIGTGRTFTAEAGATVNLGAATVTLPANVPRLATFEDPNTDTVWLWDDSANAWVLSTFTMSVVTSGANIQLSGDSASPGNNKLYGTNGSGVKGWYDQPSGGGGSGSVTSVGLSLPAIFTVTNSPVTSTGTLTGALAAQSANTIFAGPTTGVAAAPTFRAMVAADVPNLTLAKISDAGGAAALNVGTTGGTVAAGNHDHTGVYQASNEHLSDLADGSLTGTKVGFSNTGGHFSATSLDAAILELRNVNGSGPNAANGKVEWSQLVGVPAGFADGNDDGGVGGSGSMTTAQEGGVQVGGSDIVTLNFDAGFDLVESPDTKITISFDASEVLTGGDLSWSGNTPSIAANAVALGTDTTGNYVATVAGTTNQISVSGSGSETAAVTVALADDVIVPTTITVPNTGLRILDTNATHDLVIVPGSNLTADRNLTFTTGDAARTVTLSGDLNVSSAATVSGTNTGDQTITLTGDVTGTGTGSFSTTVANNAISNAKLRQSAGLSLVGNASASTANVADITATSTGQVLRYSGSTLGFGAVDLDDTDAVTGTLAVANGGTNLASGTSGGVLGFTATGTIASSAALTANGVVIGGGAGATPTATAAGTANQAFRVPSGGGAPAFGALDISQSAAVTGVLNVANLSSTVILETEIDTSSELRGIVTDETGTGALVFAESPTLVTPALGTPTSGNFGSGTFTWPTFNQNTTGNAATATTASAGDSATAFFSSGTIEDERLPAGLTRDAEAAAAYLGITAQAADVDPAGNAIAVALLNKSTDNRSDGRNVATVSSGSFTTSNDRNAAAGKRHQVLTITTSDCALTMTTPSGGGEESYEFEITAASTHSLTYDGKTIAPGYTVGLKWLGGSWRAKTDTPSEWLASATPLAPGTAAVGTATKAAREDHVHAAQTTITGNAGTATALQNARTINGVSFDGTANIVLDAVAHSTLTYASTVTIDFTADQWRTVTLTGNIEFATSNLAAGKKRLIRIVGDGSSRTLTFPADWKFLGTKPTALAAGKVAILSLSSFGTANTAVVAGYAVEL